MYALALARNTLAGLLVGNPAYLRGGPMFSATSRHPLRAGVRQSRGLGAETVIPFHQDAVWDITLHSSLVQPGSPVARIPS